MICKAIVAQLPKWLILTPEIRSSNTYSHWQLLPLTFLKIRKRGRDFEIGPMKKLYKSGLIQ